MDEQGSEHVEELGLDPVAVVRKRRPHALWAVLAVVGVAAGALVVTSADDDGNQRPGLPVDLGSAARATSAEGAADASMPAWIQYVAGDDLPALGGEGTAYRVSGGIDEAQVRELADALGLAGEIESDGAGSWWVTGGEGVGRLDVYAGGGAYWSFYNGEVDCVTADGSVGRCDDDVVDCLVAASGPRGCGYSAGAAIAGGSSGQPMCEGGVEFCVEPTTTTYVSTCEADDPQFEAPSCEEVECPDPAACAPTPDLPPLEGEDDARRVALDVVAASGADVDGALVDAVDGGESRSWYITVEPVVDDVPTGLFASVEVSDAGVVLSGSGFFGDPEPLGSYPLLDTRAVIDRANTQSSAPGGIEPAVDTPAIASGSTGGADTGTTDDLDAPVTTVVGSTDPCAAPEGASDGCGGTTGCEADGCNDVGVAEEPPTTYPCKVQPDGSEICEYDTCEPMDAGASCEVPICPQAVPGEDIVVGAPESIDCTPPPPDPGVDPIPDPQPVEIVLVEARRSLVLLPANDGSPDAYLVPAYRFTAEDGGTVDLPAVADEALSGSSTTETTVPDPIEPEPLPEPEPQPCVLEEADASGTTHTVQICGTDDPETLPPGEEPVIGVGYYVDIDLACGMFGFGYYLWINEDGTVATWADSGESHEGGTFTLEDEHHGTFVGDAAGTKVAEFRALGPAEDIWCVPEPRG